MAGADGQTRDLPSGPSLPPVGLDASRQGPQTGGMPTLKDVARACGVDVSTVSRALAGNVRVSVRTRARVVKIAAKLGYVPNLAARSLQAGKTGTLWLIVQSLDNRHDREPTQHAVRAAEAAGYDLLVAVAGDADALLRLGRRLAQGICDGALIIPGAAQAVPGFLKAIPSMPVVFVDRWPERMRVAAVTSANHAAAAALVEGLAQSGCEALLLGIEAKNSVQHERRQGALAAARRLGLRVLTARGTGRHRLGILANDQSTAQRLLADHEGHARTLAVFDTWIGDPWPAQGVLVVVQDFAAMARRAVDRLVEAVGANRPVRPGIDHVPILGIETVLSRVGV